MVRRSILGPHHPSQTTLLLSTMKGMKGLAGGLAGDIFWRIAGSLGYLQTEATKVCVLGE